MTLPLLFDLAGKRVYVAGHNGMAGSAIVRRKAGVKKLLALGSSCIYPKLAAQPMTEDSLLTGPLEPTNEW
jgi:nucleoside-diphosphate-sugar epimerase